MLEAESARLAALRGTPADFVLITRRYEEMVAAHGKDTVASTHARLDHAFHLAICEASHNPVLVHTLDTLTDLLLSSVFASVNNLYHREPQKRVIDRQHARLYNAVTGKLPEQARKAASRAHQERARELQGDRTGRATARARLRCGSTAGGRGSLAVVQMAPDHAGAVHNRIPGAIAFVIRRVTVYAENLADGPRLRCQRESRLS